KSRHRRASPIGRSIKKRRQGVAHKHCLLLFSFGSFRSFLTKGGPRLSRKVCNRPLLFRGLGRFLNVLASGRFLLLCHHVSASCGPLYSARSFHLAPLFPIPRDH